MSIQYIDNLENDRVAAGASTNRDLAIIVTSLKTLKVYINTIMYNLAGEQVLPA